MLIGQITFRCGHTMTLGYGTLDALYDDAEAAAARMCPRCTAERLREMGEAALRAAQAIRAMAKAAAVFAAPLREAAEAEAAAVVAEALERARGRE